MNNILFEKEYQKYIIERLEKDNGYMVRSAKEYDRLFAMDREMLFEFLEKYTTRGNGCFTKSV